MIDGFLNKIYDTQSSNSSTFDQDLSKFSDMGSPKSVNSRKSINKTFKQLLTENYSDYLARLRAVRIKAFKGY